MKPSEIIRIIVISAVGGLLTLYIQPWVYQNRWIPVNDVPLNQWLSNYYMTGAWIVFLTGLVATIIWSVLTATAKASGAVDVFRWQVVWFILGLLPLAGICVGIWIGSVSNDALLTLALFFIIDGLFVLYWLPTVTSTPGLFRNIPPGAPLIRGLIR
jgi:hypothetical protein